jgi:hypothetical protein
MSDPCKQEANIAVIKQRLESGDTILEKLEKSMEMVVSNVSELLHCVKGDDGLLAKQREHGLVINKIVNLDIIDKVSKHDKWYIIGAFLIGFLGLCSVSSIVALLMITVRLFKAVSGG